MGDVDREMLAFGWMYAEACALLDAGVDLRQVEVPELLERYKKSLGENHG